MATLVKRGDKYYLVAHGGYRNRDKIAPTEVEVVPPLQKVDEFTYIYPDNPCGSGHNTIIIYNDAQGKTIAVHKFSWSPEIGYSWAEDWESVTDDPKEIEKLKMRKETIIQENL